jgi:hypothetical protein
MSRISDTRFRTREAAARLVTAGRQTHEVTVDLIYAEIRQGSRTTINDELKLWKDEQTKVDALSPKISQAKALVKFSRCKAAQGAAREEIELKWEGNRAWDSSQGL